MSASPGSVDMTFVTADVWGGTWLEWGSSITGVTDMVDQAIAKLGPGQCIGRLIICAHGSEGGAYMQFDPSPDEEEVKVGEVIDGTRIDRHVKDEFQRLRRYMCPDGVIELRCCHFGAGDKGKQALQAIADLTGVAVTAPEETIAEVMGLGGISCHWATAYPSNLGIPATSSFWRGSGVAAVSAAGEAGAAAVAAEPRFVPVKGIPAPEPPGPAAVSDELLRSIESSLALHPDQGYSELNRLGAYLDHPPEPDTPPPGTFTFGGPQVQPVPAPGPYLYPTSGESPGQPSIDDTVRRGCLTLSVRNGCAALALVVALAGVTTYIFGFGRSSHSSAGTGPAAVTSTPPSAAGCSGPAKLIVDQFYPDVVLGGGGAPPTFSTGGKRYCLVHLATYHWNGGKGDAPAGTLTLVDSRGKEVGRWPATATPGTGGALVNWEADVSTSPPVILDGTYKVEDSHPQTLSWSNASGHQGFVRVWGIDYTGP